MEKLINKKIIDTEKMKEIASRTSHYSHSNNAIGWETIYLSDKTYYLCTCGGNDIFSPEDNIEVIGDYATFMEFVSDDNWNRNTKVIEHVKTIG